MFLLLPKAPEWKIEISYPLVDGDDGDLEGKVMLHKHHQALD